MNFDLKTLDLRAAAAEKCDQLVVLVGQGFAPGADPLSMLIADAIKHKDFEPKPGQSLAMYQSDAVAARRLVLAGIGAGDARAVRQAIAAIAPAFRTPGTKRAVVCFSDTADASVVSAAVQGVAQACYVYTHTKPKAQASPLLRVVLGVCDPAVVADAFEASQAVAQGVELAREWGNRPANHATPRMLADAAKVLAKYPGMACKVMGPAEVERLKMGAFLAVAQGAEEPLRFIELRYTGAARSQPPVVIVGKGITFDTGGISIKPAPEMDEMKFDMCGAASVLGVFRALAQLQPAINVVGLIPACENMPDGRAVKPGDVVTSMSGQTIEILNTDAEGRLVLCDALTYAMRHKPTAIVDIATLTGACVIALGGVRTGLFASDDALAGALLAAGENAGDLAWRMPLDEEYAEGLKSNFADLANVAGRPAGSVTAAKFLQSFVGEVPWVHLDIAGTAWKGGAAKGATGRPVALLVHWLLAHATALPVDGAKTKGALARAKTVKPRAQSRKAGK
ncbi:MAG: leucyl aminopeptidase [Giesbergeria sp.]